MSTPFIALSPRTPDDLWVTISVSTDGLDEPDINVMLWATEESAKHHMREAVRFSESEIGEHYADCAALDAMADWQDGIGGTYERTGGGYSIAASKKDVFLAFPSGYRSVSLYKADLKAGRVNNIPVTHHGESG